MNIALTILWTFLTFSYVLISPLSWVMEGAAIVSIALSNGENRPPDWQDFVGIMALLLIVSDFTYNGRTVAQL